nr:T9SS type A sorting domain-containing protein [Bacteroidota bacterium]
QLSWLPVPQQDLNYYAIYRSEEANTFPDQPFITSINPFVSGVPLDPNTYYYAVTSIDYTGNESQKSNVVLSPVADQLSISAGWSGVSSWIVPQNNQISYVMAPIATDLILLQGSNGIYWPGQNLNTLGSWNTHEGYIIKVADNTSLPLTGYKESDFNWGLTSGWQIMPVLTPCLVQTDELQNQLGENLVMVKEIAGWRVYWPEMGIQSLGFLEPGKAYYLNTLSGAGSFVFPDCDVTKSSVSQSQKPNGESRWTTPEPNLASHTIALSNAASLLLKPGDCIGVFNNMGECAGSSWITEHAENNCITAFGNDPATWQNEGLNEGEAMHFRLYRPDTDDEFELEAAFAAQFPNADGKFANNGISVIEGFKLNALGQQELTSGNIRVYPNPGKGNFHISGILPGTAFEVLDNHGLLLQCGTMDAEAMLDLGNAPAGVYFIKLFIGDQIKMLKVIKN